MTSIVNTSFKLVSEYDNSGIRAAMKDQDEFSRKMIAGMTESGQSGKTDPMMAKLSNLSQEQIRASEEISAKNRAALQTEAETARRIDVERRQAAISLAAQKQESLQAEAEASRKLDVERRQAALSLSEQRKSAIAEEEAAWRKQLASKSNAMNAGVGGQGGSAGLAASLADEAAANQVKADKQYWAERGRMRDQDIKDQIQADNLVRMQSTADEQTARKASADALRLQKLEALDSLKSQGQQLRLGMLTESQRTAMIRKADLEHLQMLMKFNSISKDEFEKLSQQAGKLNLTNIGQGIGSGSASGNKTAMIAQQLGFGMQDFSSQIANSKNGIDGLGRGLMAVSNNAQMLGSAFGPTGLAITAIGGSLVGIIVPQMIKWLDLSREASKAADATTKAILEQVDAIAKLRAAQRGPDADRGKTAFEQAKQNEADIRTGEEKAKALRAQLAEANNIVEMEKNADRERTHRLMNEQKLVPATMDRIRVGLNVMGGGEGTIQSEATANAKKTAQDLADELRTQEQALQDNRRKQAAIEEEFGKDIKNQEDLRNKEREQKMLEDARRLGGELQKIEEEKQKAIDRARDEEIERNRRAIQSDLDEQLRAADVQQSELAKQMDSLRQGNMTANGSSAALRRGTSAATSAISRAIAGTASVEDGQRAQLRALEQLHKDLQDVKQQLNFKRGSI